MMWFPYSSVFTAWCYASAVCAVVGCLSIHSFVCLYYNS